MTSYYEETHSFADCNSPAHLKDVDIVDDFSGHLFSVGTLTASHNTQNECDSEVRSGRSKHFDQE
jgi:hypothetical protein